VRRCEVLSGCFRKAKKRCLEKPEKTLERQYPSPSVIRIRVWRDYIAPNLGHPELPERPPGPVAQHYIFAWPLRIDSLNCGLVKLRAASRAA
jgi:hypothetical protein